jgi:hypothetical protein
MSGLNLQDSEKHPENIIWKKVVPVINIVTLVISLFIFLSIDSRLKSEYSEFYTLMFPHLIISFLFFLSEWELSKKFSNSTSKYDTTLILLIIYRNIIVVAGVTPFIQLLAIVSYLTLLIWLPWYFYVISLKNR